VGGSGLSKRVTKKKKIPVVIRKKKRHRGSLGIKGPEPRKVGRKSSKEKSACSKEGT